MSRIVSSRCVPSHDKSCCLMVCIHRCGDRGGEGSARDSGRVPPWGICQQVLPGVPSHAGERRVAVLPLSWTRIWVQYFQHGFLSAPRRVAVSSLARSATTTTTLIAGTRYLDGGGGCLLYTSPSPRDKRQSRMPSSA